MLVSLNIILEVLQAYNTDNYVGQEGPKGFNQCLPLPDDLQELSRECLYIGRLSRALTLPKDICCICVRDRLKDDRETPDNLSGLVVVNDPITQNDLLIKIANRVFAVMNWVQQMNEVLLNNGTLQDLVDLCPPVLDNYLAINDASLMLLAYSRAIPCDDPICIEFVKNGYHTEEYVRKFRKYNLLKTWESANGIFVDESCEVAKYVAVHKVFRVHNAYFAHIVMTCNRSPADACLLELFQLFTDVVDKYIRRVCEGKSSYIHIYDSLLTDLIEKKTTKRKIIEERAQYVGLPLTGPFCFFRIKSKDSANLAIGKMLKEFSAMFPRFKFVNYNKCIVAINAFLQKDLDGQLKAVCTDLESFAEKYDAQCGVSQMFYSLEETPYAFQQASLALKYMKQADAGALFNDDQHEAYSRVHFFTQKFMYGAVGEADGQAELWYHSAYCQKLKKLHEYDLKHQNNYFQLLNVFLSRGQNAAEVGKLLGTHRNNVMYHITRAKEILELDFDKPSVRFMLQSSLVMLELYGLE